MKMMFVSDTHGSAHYCRKMSDIYGETGAKCLVLLGDILCHGPHDDLPRDCVPKEVIAILNPVENETYAARGNCDTEVDQMVLDFPIMANYGLFVIEDKTFYATHGHVFGQDRLPSMKEGDILVHGHTHLSRAKTIDNTPCGRITVLNPRSASMSKGGNPHTYAMLVDGVLRVLTLDGDLVKEMRL